MREDLGLFGLMGQKEREEVERELEISFLDIGDLMEDVRWEFCELEAWLNRLFRGATRK